MFETFVAAFAIMSASFAGVVFIQRTAREFLESRLSHLVSFSAGVFLVTAGALALETLNLIDTIWHAVGFVVFGYGLAWGLHYLLPETHHHHDTDCERRHGGARKLIVGDSIHNVADGIVLVPAFAVSPIIGVTVAVSIFIHELLQEVSEFFVLRQNGYSVKRALLINGVVSSTILIGVAIGTLALSSMTLEGALLGVSAGFFFHVVVHDLWPRRSDHATRAHAVEQLLLVGLGVLAMAGIATLLEEAHLHGPEGEEQVHEGRVTDEESPYLHQD